MVTLPSIDFSDLIFGDVASVFTNDIITSDIKCELNTPEYFTNVLLCSLKVSQVRYWSEVFNEIGGHYVGLDRVDDGVKKTALIFKNTMNVACVFEICDNCIITTIFKSYPPIKQWFERKGFKKVSNQQSLI